MGISIKQIAELAGVSKSTVSRVISEKGYASAEAREKVLEAIRRTPYKPNAVARAMVSQRTRNIGVIIYRNRHPIVSHPVYGPLLDSILTAAQRKNYAVILATDDEMSLKSADYMLEQRVDGLILISRLRDPIIAYIKRFNVPYVMVNGSTQDKNLIHFVNRDEAGGRMAADYLVQSGHRSVLIVAGPQSHRSHYLRLAGFRNRLLELGLRTEDFAIRIAENSDFECGYAAVSDLPALQGRRATAVFATNDMMALGAIKRLGERGLRIPIDVSVMGFDDIAMAGLYSPSLTTIHVDRARMAEEALETLDQLIAGNPVAQTTIAYEPKLIIRESTSVYTPLNNIIG